jgi:hypothetical protein
VVKEERKEEEGLQGVFKRLRRNGHQPEKKKKRGYRVCSSGYADTDTSQKKEEEEGLQGVFKRLRRNGHQLEKGLQMAQRGPSLK